MSEEKEKIKRLEDTVELLIIYLQSELGAGTVSSLLNRLYGQESD